MATKKKPTVKGHITTRIARASMWINTAKKDIGRNDRLDALDSLRFAEREIRNARNSIRSSLPAEARS